MSLCVCDRVIGEGRSALPGAVVPLFGTSCFSCIPIRKTKLALAFFNVPAALKAQSEAEQQSRGALRLHQPSLAYLLGGLKVRLGFLDVRLLGSATFRRCFGSTGKANIRVRRRSVSYCGQVETQVHCVNPTHVHVHAASLSLVVCMAPVVHRIHQPQWHTGSPTGAL